MSNADAEVGFEKIDRIRRGGTVGRYHTHRLNRPPNNAEHQWAVAILVDYLWRQGYDEPNPTLVVQALYHDVAEFDTGDSPAWVKRANPALKEGLAAMERVIEARLGIDRPEPGSEEHAVLKVADELEHLWTCLDERRAGNVDVDNMFVRGMGGLRRMLSQHRCKWPWYDAATVLRHDLEMEYRRIAGTLYGQTEQEVHEGADYFSRRGDRQHLGA